MIALISTLLTGCTLTFWGSSGLLLGMRSAGASSPGANLLWQLTKWPAFVNIFARPVCWILLEGNLTPFNIMIFVFDAVGWWLFRNAGDDDWTRRFKDKCASIVRSVGHRLVVVPAPT